MEVGFETAAFRDVDRDRPILIDFWYPVTNQIAHDYDYGLGRGRVVPSGTIAPGKFPLVLLSHGAMGAARNYSWIAEGLASRGFIVAGISHYGESYMFGEQTIDPASVLDSEARPLDVSAALTHIQNKSAVASSVDPAKIGFIGHSSGGATAMHLAGVLFDQQRMAEYCASTQSAGDRGCDYAALVDSTASSNAPAPALKSFAEPRLQAIVALDPALGPGFFDYSGVDEGLDILIIGSVHNDFLPFQQHAERYAKHLMNADHYWLDNGEGHFVYLNECASDLQANGIPLCIDRPDVSRSAVHAELEPVIYHFFQKSFSPTP